MHNLVKYCLYDNHWLWFHILVGTVLGKVAVVLSIQPQLVLWGVGGLAVGYELVSYITGGWRNYSPIKSRANLSDYERSQKQRFLLDAVGDVAGAVLAALVVVL